MMRPGHTKCRNLSKPSNLGIALQVSRQAMAEEVEQDGCRTMLMDFKGFCCFIFSLTAILRGTWKILRWHII